MGTSTKKGSTKAAKKILDQYMDNSTNTIKIGQEKDVCIKITNEYFSRRKKTKGYFDPEKLSGAMAIGFGGYKKIKDDFNGEANLEIIEEKIKEFLEEENDELQTEVDEEYRRAFIEAITGAILADENKDRIFIEGLIINTIKLGVLSELQEEIIQRYDKENSFDFGKEIEICIKNNLKESMDHIYENVMKENWEVLSNLITDIKGQIRGQK